jgi:protocatechuate 3,4-dioxygenase alpha subunit
MAKLTPAQTIGPFFHEGLKWAIETSGAAPADAVRIAGRVLDREGAGVSDALLEIWRPGWRTGAAGGAVVGLQRVATDDSGGFAFYLPRPAQGPVHANVTVFARGLLRGLFTRVYLHEGTDPARVVLPESVPAARRGTLIARRGAAGAYQWDVCLSGTNETVFFDL